MNKSIRIYVERLMGRWESLIDKKIREAMEQGEFDNLAGKGKPMDLSENPFEDPNWRTAHRLLRNAGFTPAWIEERKDIDAELEAARINLARGFLVLRNACNTQNEERAKVRWQKKLDSFREQVTELNRRINAWNLKAPGVVFHRTLIDAEREIARIASKRSTVNDAG